MDDQGLNRIEFNDFVISKVIRGHSGFLEVIVGHLKSWLKIQMAQSMVKFIALKKSQFVTKIYGFSKKSLKKSAQKVTVPSNSV